MGTDRRAKMMGRDRMIRMSTDGRAKMMGTDMMAGMIGELR
ncbi:unnamed protein product [uncultured virus]|nr:unnamed protein product [uncultured virus]